MRSIFWIIAILIAAAMSFGSSAEAQEAQPADCTNAETQMAMNECTGKDFKASDAELNAVYKEIMTRLKGQSEKIALLKDAQRAWIKFRDAECTFAASAVEGGSIYPTVRAECANDLTKIRIKQIKTFLACQEGDLACPVPPAAAP